MSRKSLEIVVILHDVSWNSKSRHRKSASPRSSHISNKRVELTHGLGAQSGYATTNPAQRTPSSLLRNRKWGRETIELARPVPRHRHRNAISPGSRTLDDVVGAVGGQVGLSLSEQVFSHRHIRLAANRVRSAYTACSRADARTVSALIMRVMRPFRNHITLAESLPFLRLRCYCCLAHITRISPSSRLYHSFLLHGITSKLDNSLKSPAVFQNSRSLSASLGLDVTANPRPPRRCSCNVLWTSQPLSLAN